MYDGFEMIVSPYEADPQISYLVREEYADFGLSEDSDLLVYKCNQVGLLDLSLRIDQENRPTNLFENG